MRSLLDEYLTISTSDSAASDNLDVILVAAWESAEAVGSDLLHDFDYSIILVQLVRTMNVN